jgi:hypothetical protein
MNSFGVAVSTMLISYLQEDVRRMDLVYLAVILMNALMYDKKEIN